jgi:hypothetical protein
MVKRDEHIAIQECGTSEPTVRDTDRTPRAADTQSDDAEPGAVFYRPEMGAVIVRYDRQDSELDRAAR